MTMRRHIILFVGILCVLMPLKAENTATDFKGKQEFRIGAGDNLTDVRITRNRLINYEIGNNYITPNIFIDYSYHFCHWFALGVQINTIWWGGDANSPTQNRKSFSYLYGNTAIMPTFRFTYFRVPTNNVALYSSVYGGYCAGVEQEGNTCYYNHGWSAGVTALGVSFGGEHWFGAAELGALFGYAGNLQLGSRILSLAAGYRF